MKTKNRIAPALLALTFALLACGLPFPAIQAHPAGTLLPTATFAAAPTAPVEATAFAPTQAFTLVRIYPRDGQLHALLAAEVQIARARGQTPFVEFDATWCPPCQAITTSLAKKDPLMLKAYAGVYLIHADVDAWGWDNRAAGFPTVQAIPAFFALRADGTPSGAAVDGGAWGADIPQNIAPVLGKFFHP